MKVDKGAAIYLALAAAALMDSGRYGQGSQSGERVSWKDNGRGRSLPMPEDVLCGRGGATNHWSGNQFVLRLVRSMSEEYYNLERNLQKRVLVDVVLHRVHSRGGRFLEKRKDGTWQELSAHEARTKIRQKFTDSVQVYRKSQAKQSTKEGSEKQEAAKLLPASVMLHVNGLYQFGP